MTSCKECGQAISNQAAACPHCGYKIRRTTGFTKIVAAFFGLIFFIALFSRSEKTPDTVTSATKTKSPEQLKQDAALQRAIVGARALKKASRNPGEFVLEQALVMGDGGVCYTYRAQNGFGGMNRGNAAMSVDGKFLSNEDPGFLKLWNAVCDDKSGDDVTTGIRWTAL